MADMTRITHFALWAGSLLMTLVANAIAPISILAGGARGFQVAKANDSALNAALGGNWKETISLHCAKARQAGKWWGGCACKLLDRVTPGHCDDMIQTGDD
jgi:hypothetical protein